jgi:hypothetical protein
VQTFTANLPIQAGDLIGIDSTSAEDEIGIAEVPGASYSLIFPTIFDGATVAASDTKAGKEIELSAEVQPAPAITKVTPNFGSIAGGAAVTITGTNLNSASAVRFGATPATSFTVDSETQVTAIAPASATAGAVDITVTTIAGTSPAVGGDRFAYFGCEVPKLSGKRLKAAKRSLRRADCRLGLVKHRRHKPTKKVTKQNPKPGQLLAPGSKVNIILGR